MDVVNLRNRNRCTCSRKLRNRLACAVLFITQKSVEPLQKLFEKYVNKSLEFRRTKCRELVVTSHLNAVISLCVLLDTFANADNGVSTYTCTCTCMYMCM